MEYSTSIVLSYFIDQTREKANDKYFVITHLNEKKEIKDRRLTLHYHHIDCKLK